MNESEKIDFLALGLKNMGHRKSYPNHIPEVDSMYDRLQAALLGIPGHAEYYQNRINEARAKVDEAKKSGNVGNIGHYRGLLSNEVTFAFPTLSHLPSVETVRVLGEFLYDERGYVKLPPEPTLLQLDKAAADSPVYDCAAKALTALPIENKPVPEGGKFYTPEDTLPWRQWYEEIQSGKRTFRFEGDPTEYDLNGPAPNEKLERIARDRKRDAERLAGRGDTTGSSTEGSETPQSIPESDVKNVTIASVVAGLILFSSLVWYFARKKARWSH
jgi:hypothetical protein